ncbi:MSHA biogenesis protein MshP [Vibrio aestuarianus]|uniref:MSHA biogenesis protein MshP n=1 Tax=Vibrio aestuarianus TaxID=28171 RepID=UPI00237CD160|nr:MSHA biogenesis protein MshP [Vibrio aestuarianus]MDE1209184.1 MSHA biogenesis protein MshP [Vibrio aestuarianus]
MMRLSTTHHRQQGSGLVLVIFIIVVVGFVAAVANRNQQRNSQQLVSMVLGTRAEMAARSAMQIDISRFYSPQEQGSCRLGTHSNYTFEGEGLERCEAKVSCRSIGVLDDSGYQVYQLESIGTCKAGDSIYQRIIEAGIRDDS